MDLLFGFVTRVLFCLSVYALARAYEWRRPSFFLLLGAVVGGLFVVAFAAAGNPNSARVHDIIVAVFFVAPFLALFALSQSVANLCNVRGANHALG